MIPIQELRSRFANGEHIRSLIKENLRSTKLVLGQLDPNGHCNAKCWFCPVKYEGNPKEYEVQMTAENLDAVLASVRAATVVDQVKFFFMYTAHYNEVLLYKHFDQLPAIFRKNNFKTMVLTNGTPLSPAKTDIIMANTDVITDICLNVPAIERSDWAEKAGFNENIHDILLRNLDYLHQKSTIRVSVNINSITEWWAKDLKTNGFFTSVNRANRIAGDFKTRWPKFEIVIADGLVDRAGLLSKVSVLKNERAIMMPGQTVIGCQHDLASSGSRIYGWLHINAKGDVFLCCDDYKMEYKFGNLLENSLDEIWLSEKHVDMIEQSFKQLCLGCCHHLVNK